METTSKQIYLHTLIVPEKWQAGKVGDKPFYFDCARCEATEPPIAGFLSTSETAEFEHILVIGKRVPFALALFCEDCWKSLNERIMEDKDWQLWIDALPQPTFKPTFR